MADDGTNVEIKLKEVTLSFCDSLFEAKAFGDDADAKPYHKANFLIDKVSQKDIAVAVSNAVKGVIAAKWPTNPPKLSADKKCFRDGEPKDEETGEPSPLYEGYAGKFFVSAARRQEDGPPVMIDSRKGQDDKFPRLTPADGKMYGGAVVNAIVRIWAQDNKWGRRVNASLEAIQFVRHGTAFGATRVDADSAFDDLGAEDDDFAPAKPADDDDLV